MSGGASNIFMEACSIEDSDTAVYFKANLDRGGYIRNVAVRDIDVNKVQYFNRFQTDYHGYRGGNFPPIYRDFLIEDSTCQRATEIGIVIDGVEDAPIENITYRNIDIVSAEKDTRIPMDQSAVSDRGYSYLSVLIRVHLWFKCIVTYCPKLMMI